MAKYDNIFVALDTETGGLPSVEKKEATTEVALTEIALVSIDNEKLEIISEYSELIAPYSDQLIYSPKAEKISGISKKMCEDEGSDIEQVYKNTKSFLISQKISSRKPIIIIQNESFDTPFLVNLFKMFKDNFFKYISGIEDTMEYSRKKWPLESKHNLGAIAERCGIDHVEAHRAGPDTITAAEIWIYFMKCLRGEIGSGNNTNNFRFSFKF